jgi:prepilin-type N-terminal cleavage/methylation domain-containing protein
MMKSKGFTLIELLVVIAIIAILSSVVLASLSTARAKSRDARRMSDMNELHTALELYFDANSRYPTTTTADVSNRVRSKDADPGWTALEVDMKNFIPKLPIDPVNTGSFYYVYDPTPVDANPGCPTNTPYTLYFGTEVSVYSNLTSYTPPRSGVAGSYCIY